MVCDDLGMTDYIIHAENRTLDQGGMKHKEKADLLEGEDTEELFKLCSFLLTILKPINVFNYMFQYSTYLKLQDY